MFIYFDDGFVKKMADCIEVDDIPGSYKTSCHINGIPVRIYPFNIHTELKDELKYPSLTWKRYDRKFDPTRYVNDPQSELFKTKDENGKDVFIQMDSPKPMNFFYQLELRAKSQHDIDMLELWFESHVDLRGDVVTIPIFIEESGTFCSLDFPLDLVEYRILDDVESDTSTNEIYRRVYSFKVMGLVDMNNFKSNDSKSTIGVVNGEDPVSFSVNIID